MFALALRNSIIVNIWTRTLQGGTVSHIQYLVHLSNHVHSNGLQIILLWAVHLTAALPCKLGIL